MNDTNFYHLMLVLFEYGRNGPPIFSSFTESEFYQIASWFKDRKQSERWQLCAKLYVKCCWLAVVKICLVDVTNLHSMFWLGLKQLFKYIFRLIFIWAMFKYQFSFVCYNFVFLVNTNPIDLLQYPFCYVFFSINSLQWSSRV